ncbi:copper resistance protein CopC [Aquibacillus salsiterrae]|uniref:Copper resistance protein CopC n=1 Tax=Aquibacillus salsiterrae TaxID=2950439 RepID=A0A9X3WE27_9BACI|nr:copper resistance protein CopC [Aquibacillus salsiterrae]MDC3418160.1 copper resistance protein CopC [Aquibacillus salsiterrae]
MYIYIRRVDILFFLVLLCSFFLFSSVVSAHSSLKETYPEGNAVLETPPDKVEIWFQDPVAIHKESIQIIDSNKKIIQTGQTKVDPDDKRHLTTVLRNDLAAGDYKVKMNVIAQDGFVIEEQFTFTVAEQEKQESLPEELELVKSNVSDGEIFQGSPNKIDLWFNQPAEITAFGIFNENYQPVATGTAEVDESDPNHLFIPISEPLNSGTYQITWYAAPVSKAEGANQADRVGVFYFAVDQFTSMEPVGGYKTKIDTNTFSFSFGLKQLAYWLSFIGLTVLFGLSWFHSFIHKAWTTRKIIPWFYTLGILGIVLLIVDHRLDLPQLDLKNFILVKFVWIPIVQIILITLGLFVRKLRLLFIGLALLLWPFVIGHASYPRYGGYLTMAVSAVHILAVGIWMGGLVALLAKPKDQDGLEWIKQVGPNFSKWALVSVISIIISGVWMSIAFLPSFTFVTLIESEWGRMLLMKVVFFLFLLLLGYFQRKAVIRISAAAANTFIRKIRTEVIYGICILFFAASLVAANPSAAERGVYPETTDQEDLGLIVDIAPIQMGLNTISLEFAKDVPIEDVTVQLDMPPDWQIEVDAFEVEEGLYKLTGNLLHAAGTINMTVRVTLASGELVEIPYRIVVPGEVRFNE